MEVQRRLRTVQAQDRENVFVTKGKINIPSKRQGLTVQNALGELNTNVQAQRDINIGKVSVSAVEFEKKSTISRGIIKSSYGHVQSKVDTGLAVKTALQPSSRPPLRREESTGFLAAKAMGNKTRATLKDNIIKQNDLKEAVNSILLSRKCNGDLKKSSKLPTVKEKREANNVLKPILKESTESLRKLKVAENSDKSTEVKSKENIEVHLEPLLSDPCLPNDIEDIDANDKNSPLLMSVYIKDIYKYLTDLEEKYPIEVDHLKNQRVITGKMRATLIDWLVEVQRQFSLVLETFQLTVGIIDRYLQCFPATLPEALKHWVHEVTNLVLRSGNAFVTDIEQAVPNVERSQLQLVGVTAMFIASKYEEIYAPEVCDFVYVTDKAYNKTDVTRCEREIMSKLGFCLARPIPLSFLRRFVKAAHGTSKNHHLAKYFVDLSLVEYSMAHYRPSELAAAAICLSLYLLSNKPLSEVWTPKLAYYSCYNLKHIEPIIRKIAKIVTNVDSSKYKAVYNKYSDVTLAKVSNLPQLRGEAIQQLANDCP